MARSLDSADASHESKRKKANNRPEETEYRKGIGVGPARILIPSDVGEIDYLGYSESERLLLVGEFKMVRHGFEPTFFRDDVSDFVESKKAYAKKFRKKVEWVALYLNDVVAALESEPNLPDRIDPKGMAKVLVTGFPSFASYFIADFPCVSVVELRVAYEKQSAWPYELHC